MCPPAKGNGVWPFNDAWLRTSLSEARRQAPRNGASILDAARELGIRDAQASGIETPTRADLARLDRTRPKKGRHTDWRHPHDPDARITKMKDGRTHLAHTAEHAVAVETGAIVGVTVQGVRLEFQILSLPPGLRQRCVAPDVWPTLSRA